MILPVYARLVIVVGSEPVKRVTGPHACYIIGLNLGDVARFCLCPVINRLVSEPPLKHLGEISVTSQYKFSSVTFSGHY